MLHRSWPAEGVTRVPYWVYQDAEIYAEEQARIWRGRTWNYLCLEAELAEPRSFVTTFVGDMPVVVTRDANGALHAWENRCAHRGALVAVQARGTAERFTSLNGLVFGTLCTESPSLEDYVGPEILTGRSSASPTTTRR